MPKSPELTSWESDGNPHVSLRRTEPRAHHIVIAEAVRHYSADTASILDFGCGIGQLSEQIARRMPDAIITAADPYDACLEATAIRLPGVRCVKVAEDTIDIDAFSSTFDIVVIAHVLEHTLAPLDALTKLMSLVKPGGYCIVAVPNPARPKVLWYGLRKFNYVNHGHVMSWDPAHWRNFLERIAHVDVVEYLGDEVQFLPPQLTNRISALRELQRRTARLIPWWAFSNIAVVRR